MLKFLTFSTLAMACMPTAPSAQGVDYRSFVVTGTALPSRSVKPSPAGTHGPSEDQLAARAPLALDFEALGTDAQSIAQGARPLQVAHGQRPVIPAWMRAKSSLAPLPGSHFFSAGRSTGFARQDWQQIPASCPHSEYRAKGLKRAVEERRARYYTLVLATACHVGVPTELFDALITQESGYDPNALSIKGAIGMAQLMPATARAAGVVNPWDIVENLRGGAQILKSHLAEFGRYDLALAAYNAGAGRVRQTRRVPRIRETATYVSSILSDVRRQYARAIGFDGGGSGGDPTAPVRTASLVSF